MFVVYICTVATALIIFAHVVISRSRDVSPDHHDLKVYVAKAQAEQSVRYLDSLAGTPVRSPSPTGSILGDSGDGGIREEAPHPPRLSAAVRQLSLSSPPRRLERSPSVTSTTSVWVDLSEVGNTFSHARSSWYLRLGVIGKEVVANVIWK